MPDPRFPHARLTPATRRRIAALALARAVEHGRWTIAVPDLVAGASDEHATHGPGI